MFKHDIWLALVIIAVFVFVVSLLTNMIDEVITSGASSSLKGIHMAACDGDIDIVRLRLDQGIDINTLDESSKTPLYWAADRGKKDVVELLIANGADVNIKDKYGLTPLNAAATRGAKTITQILIANGAPMELPAAALLGEIGFFEEYLKQNGSAKLRRNRENLLHLAASLGGHKPIVELLIARGVEVNAQEDFFGWTPLHFAASSGYQSAAETLLANGAQANVKAQDFQTPLHLASANGHVDLTQLLIANEADINAMSNGGTPLYRAAEAGYTETAQLLIANGADVNLGDTGMTPLQRAAANGNTSVAKLLIVNGANLNARFGLLGWTPLYFANSLDTIELLKQHGAVSRMYWWAEVLESLGILHVG
jgi:ankyrin repeat protein